MALKALLTSQVFVPTSCLSVRYSSLGKTSAGKKRFRLSTEKSPEKLVNYVCGSNFYKEGEDVKVKDDSEYPDWIWKMKIHDFPKIEDYDPKSKEFWEFCEVKHLFRVYRLRSNRPKTHMSIAKKELDFEERILRSRDRALIPEAIDHGYNPEDILTEEVDPRIHLAPEMRDDAIPLDKLQPPPSFDSLTFYRAMTKRHSLVKDWIDTYAHRVKHKKVKFYS